MISRQRSSQASSPSGGVDVDMDDVVVLVVSEKAAAGGGPELVSGIHTCIPSHSVSCPDGQGLEFSQLPLT